MCTRTHTHIRGFILIWHEKYLEKIRKMLDYGIFICSFNKYFLYICFIFHVQNVSFDLRDVNVEKCEDCASEMGSNYWDHYLKYYYMNKISIKKNIYILF